MAVDFAHETGMETNRKDRGPSEPSFETGVSVSNRILGAPGGTQY